MALKRLDVLICERGLCPSREQAQSLILSGVVWSKEQRLDKPGTKLAEDIPLEIRARVQPFASRGGQKLQYALDHFQIGIKERVCLDIGASTGGFTDCLLKNGARHVFAVDVGYGQLDVKLRQDPRVTVVEKTNARFLGLQDLVTLNPIASSLSFVTMDVSFISLRKIVEPLRHSIPGLADWMLLFKPQFEVGRKNIGKGGLVRSEAAVREALSDFHAFMAGLGFILKGGPESSPITGKKSGNLEYLIHYELPSPQS